MKVWAIANQKGGVGKTTTAVSLAGCLGKRGRRVLLIDLDPHGSLTAYFESRSGAGSGDVFDLFSDRHKDIRQIIRETAIQELALVPASLALATVDRKFGGQDGMGLVIQRALTRISSAFDFVIIDCPPTLGIPMVNALAACDLIIMPVQTEYLALNGLERMVQTVGMIARSRREEVLYRVLPTLFDRRTRAANETLGILQDKYRAQLCDTIIPIDTQFREASRRGLPLSHLDPRSRGAIAYEQCTDELLQSRAAASTAVA